MVPTAESPVSAHAAAPAARPPAVRMQGICKRFGAVRANDDVTLEVAAGSVHGLVGENGAGKSTLMSILYGFYAADEGRIEVFGHAATIRRSHEAIALGIGMVHQHFMLVHNLSALDNVMLGAEPNWLLRRAEAVVRKGLTELMAATGLHVNLDALVEDLGVGDCQRLEILKALYRGAKVLILDEPTAVLTPQETEQLFQVLDTLRARGTTIVIITHKLKEVMRVCDRVTVMRAGRVVHECDIGDTSLEGLAQAMVGRKVQLGRGDDGPVYAAGAALLEAEGLRVVDAFGVTRLHGLDLRLHAGEIVGVAGVSGNGQSELLEVLSGLRVPQQGTLRLGATTFEPGRWLDPHRARTLQLAHVPEDRHARAIVLDFPAWESAVLGYEDLACYSSRGLMRHGAMRSTTADWMERYDVRPRDTELGSGKFSGGNQQKLVLARELGRAPKVLLVGQPTRGVDIGAIEFIHGRLRALREDGCAVLLVSSELDEILALADRVIVMNQGRITGELPIGQCDETRLGLLMTATEAVA
ncbi:ABC transporter ATP-binding protein [Ideonella sp. A 288]|uniref:ABC transporter ATP-binding protein n=1 Tax=Ideonella sp. A 288 TaxID=1962181 RepID=UPI000B4AB1EE|nr:ABC transporter ATP-binding protein [Ideonella sp. A 288]